MEASFLIRKKTGTTLELFAHRECNWETRARHQHPPWCRGLRENTEVLPMKGAWVNRATPDCIGQLTNPYRGRIHRSRMELEGLNTLCCSRSSMSHDCAGIYVLESHIYSCCLTTLSPAKWQQQPGTNWRGKRGKVEE